MSNVFSRHLILILLLLILILLATTWMFQVVGTRIFLIFLLFGLLINSSMIVKKHREANYQGRLMYNILLRAILLEIFILLLAMTLAALLGRNLAEIAIQHLGNDLAKLITGIAIGLLVGIVVGLMIKRVSSHFVKL